MKKYGIIIILTVAALLIGWKVSAAINAPQAYEMVEVEENDTLWDIVSKRTDNTVDVRERIYEVKQLNHIKNSGTLTPGQVIKIPVEYH